MAADSEFSAFRRVIDAISSIDADVSSSDAACSLAPRDRLCADPATCVEAAATCCAPSRRSTAVVRSAWLMPRTAHTTATPTTSESTSITMEVSHTVE